MVQRECRLQRASIFEDPSATALLLFVVQMFRELFTQARKGCSTLFGQQAVEKCSHFHYSVHSTLLLPFGYGQMIQNPCRRSQMIQRRSPSQILQIRVDRVCRKKRFAPHTSTAGMCDESASRYQEHLDLKQYATSSWVRVALGDPAFAQGVVVSIHAVVVVQNPTQGQGSSAFGLSIEANRALGRPSSLLRYGAVLDGSG